MSHKKFLLVSGLLLNITAINAEASLTAYYTAGHKSVTYSSISDITWTGDANLLGSMEASDPSLVSTIISTVGIISDIPNDHDSPRNSGNHTLGAGDFGSNGLVTWFGAKAFTFYLNTINYAGSSQWALPTAPTDPQSAYNQTGGQFGQLFYNELGGTADVAIPNTANFTNEKLSWYWLGTEDALNPNHAWFFSTYDGVQHNYNKSDEFYTWAISPGKLAAVPLPGAIWLFWTGLMGLLGFKRRRQTG